MNNVQVAALFVNVSTAAVKAEMENEQPKADIWLGIAQRDNLISTQVQAKNYVDHKTKVSRSVLDAQKQLASEMKKNKERIITTLTSLADIFSAQLLNHDDGPLGQNIEVLWEAPLAIIGQYAQGSVKNCSRKKGWKLRKLGTEQTLGRSICRNDGMDTGSQRGKRARPVGSCGDKNNSIPHHDYHLGRKEPRTTAI